jgi:sucrose-6-phosphate hydrolase SacC (GH32 family)
MSLAGCDRFGCSDSKNSDLLLSLSFDEGEGNTVKDKSGHQEDAKVAYVYSHAMYMENQDLQWRDAGVKGGSLLLDGFSTYIDYGKNGIGLDGASFSLQMWIAPRTFEWDDPNGAENGTEQLTGMIAQYDKGKKQGFILGYQRYGRLSFQVGTGDEYLTLWGDEENLHKYQWNLVSATFDSEKGEMCLYLNGKQIASKIFTAGSRMLLTKNQDFIIGRNPATEKLAAGYYNACSGLVDDLEIYQRALDAEEIQKIYEDAVVPDIAFEDIWLQNILTTDEYKTQYHGGPYQNWMNEPHAPIYYNGMYHLFFQQNMSGPYWRNICWGHLISTDMVNWKPVREAITPTEDSVVPDGVWSGTATYDVNGVPVLFFTAGNDDYEKDKLISNQNIGVAYPADLNDENLTDWVIYDELAIQQEEGQGRTGEFRDPHIWKEGDTWCMLICSGSTESEGGTALLYESDVLEVKADGTINMDWKYMGSVYEMINQPVTFGTSWEMPILLPVSNEDGTKTKYMLLISPAPTSIADNKIYYFLGDFGVNTGKFMPDKEFDNKPALLDYGCNVFTGPSVMADPVSGDVCLFSIMQDQRTGAYEGAAGWAHCVGLTRKIWLNDDGTDLMMSPIDALENQQGEFQLEESGLTVEEANVKLAGLSNDMLYIRAVIDAQDASKFGIRLKKGGTRDETVYTYDVNAGTIAGETANKGDAAAARYMSGPLSLEDGKLSLEIYIDRSLIEAFFNNKKSISIRAYTQDAESQGIEFFADTSIQIEELYITTMKSIYK